ncbi:SITS-binding protein-like isoform X2 [Paroedura picta]|uniref:SITS-binding protein-like isoform X2 n=1 Tax=Paroedura picta TaxID=143630 RepID=UPI00405782BF
MPHNRPRHPSAIPEVAWDARLKEMNETWKGGIACLGVAVFFMMTIGIIYWQVVDQPNKNWILRGSTSGLIWERKAHFLLLQTLKGEKNLLEINMRSFQDAEAPFVKNLCGLNKTEFCYTWDATADLKIFLESSFSSDTECYSINWTSQHCQVKLKDCFSMANISWYGGASVRNQRWPLNNVNMEAQPFIISSLTQTPNGYGSVLERYFLGSTGVTITIASDVPISLSVERNKHFCLESIPSISKAFLQYTVCVSPNITSAHQEVGSQLSRQRQRLPNIDLLRLPVWKYHGTVETAAKMERGIRSFFNKLQRHNFGEGLIMLNEPSTSLLSSKDHTYLPVMRRRLHMLRRVMDLSLLKTLKLSITFSPYANIKSELFQKSLQEGKEHFWLSHHSESGEYSAPLLTKWKSQFSVRLNVTNQAAVFWYMDRVKLLEQRMGAESSHLPLFVQMSPLQSDWSYAGLKGIIPSVLHYSLLGYNFFIPDAIGGTLANELLTDEELYIRWLQIVTFLPVMSFSTPPWVCCNNWVLNLTRHYINKHLDFVVPLLVKYSKEWLSLGYPVFRPVWWLSPTESVSFTIDDEFLIGDEVLVAPVTEQGQSQRDIFLPMEGQKWMDTNNGQVFDGGTFIKNYSVTLVDVPVFVRTS